jgi:predicted DCC family thiol-disulfide oxidoreductase YuxK
MTNHPTVFFDGVCGLCNRIVSFVLRNDTNCEFLFAPLQGETFQEAARRYPEMLREDSIFVLRQVGSSAQILSQSDAILFIASRLPKFCWLARPGAIVPRFIRNYFYRFIAATRYPVWGKHESCRIPSLEERSRFLP